MDEQNEMPDLLIVQGRMSRGFGIIPKLIMQDRRLSIQAKGIYAYFCSFAGSGTQAFPGVKKILYDLDMSKDTYYRHLSQLKECQYISVEQQMQDGKFARNVYTIVENVPVPPCPKNKETVKNGLESPCPKFSDTENEDTKNADTQKQATNNNSDNINILKTIKSLSRERLEKKWKTEWGFSDEMIAKAESMADVAQYPLSYMDRVLDGWRTKGIFDLSSITNKKESITEAAT
jgi:hypothetical protein